MNPYFNHLRKILILSKYQELEASRLYTELIYKRVADYLASEKTIFTTTMVPSEILAAFEAVSIDSEEVAPIIESMGQGPNSEAEECRNAVLRLGMGKDVCPYPLVTMGAFERGLLSVPAAFIGSSYMCNDQYEMIKALAQRHKRPLFIIDIPSWHDSAAIGYVENQLYEMVDFIADILNKPFNYSKFKEAMECSHEAYSISELIKQKRRYGLDVPGTEFIYFYGIQVLAGYKDSLAVFNKLHEECAQRLCDKRRLRVFWMNVLPLRKKTVIRSMIKKYNLDFVYDELSTCNMAPVSGHNPFISLAMKLLSGLYLDGIERRKRLAEEVIRDYQIDLACGFSYSRCKLVSGGTGDIRHIFQQAEIPYLEWKVKTASGSEIPDEQIKADFDSVMQAIRIRKGSKP